MTAPGPMRSRPLARELALAAAGMLLASSPLDPWLVAGLLLAGHVGATSIAPDRTRALDLALGLVWAAADVVFVHAGVFSYAHPGPLGPPVHMPLLFGQLAVALGLSLRRFPVPPPRWSGAIDLALLAGAFAAVVGLHEAAPYGLAVALSVAFVGRAVATGLERRGLALAAVFALVEPSLEATLVGAGMFTFADAGPLGLPVWYVPFFAFAAGPVARAFAFTPSWSAAPRRAAVARIGARRVREVPMSPARRTLVARAALAAFGGVGLIVMGVEGYLARVDLAFGGFAALVYGGAMLVVGELSTRRLVALLVIAGAGGLATQAVGLEIGAWAYPRPTHGFVFFAFAVGAVLNFGLVRRLSHRLARHRGITAIIARIGVATTAGVLVVDLVVRSETPAPVMVAYYGLLLAWAGAMTSWLRPATVLAALGVGATYGLAAESLGAASGLWTFGDGAIPTWLVFASWPLETVLHYGASAVVAGERDARVAFDPAALHPDPLRSPGSNP